MSEYTNAHILFLQSILQNSSLSKIEANELCEKCCNVSGVEYDGELLTFIDTINEKIQPFHLKIKRGLKEENGETLLVLINLNDKEVNQITIGGDYSKTEIEVFQHILKIILTSSNGMASSMDILNLTDEIQRGHVTKTEIETLVSKLIENKWLGEVEGWVFLEPRSILELEPYFQAQYEDYLLNCGVCKCYVFRGESCCHCNMRIHSYCSQKYFGEIPNEEKQCPSCEKNFFSLESEDELLQQSQAIPVSRERKRRHQ